MDSDRHRRREGGDGYPGARWLSGESPSEILEKLQDARELEIAARVVARLDSAAVVLDADRTYLRALAHTAHKAVLYRGDPPLDEFLAACIDRAIEDLIDEDIEGERSGAPLDARGGYVGIAKALGAELASARRICVVLNTQHDDSRRASYAVLVRRQPVEEYAAAIGQRPDRVRVLVREALRRLSRAFGREIDPKEYGL